MKILRDFKEFIITHRKLSLFILFLLVWIACSYIFYLRFPANFDFPNFFAEDGQHFTKNILEKGFVEAALTPFNGYFIIGIYLLTGIGFVLNTLLFGGAFITLPAALAITSYAFLGFCCALPILLARRYLRISYLIVIAFILSILPMPTVDYVTIGTIGNLKFPFAFIAFLLVMYRIGLPRTAKRIIFIDIALVLCAVTTIGAYFALPFLLFADGLQPKQLLLKAHWRKTFAKNNFALWGLILIAIGCIAQILYIFVHGIPTFPGYLSEPYEFSKTIELVLARPFLYPLVAVIYDHLTDIITVVISILAVLAIALFGQKKNRPIYALGLFLIASITILFISNRTGVSVHYNHYTTTGFDNFFYTQNFIAVIIFAILLSDFARRYRRFAILIFLFAGGVLFASYAHVNATYPPTEFMQYQIGSIYEQAETKCQTNDDPITFSVYPFTFLTMTVAKDKLCAKNVEEKYSQIQNFGLSVTDPLSTLNIGPGNTSFTQTFTTNSHNLDGVALYLSSYYQTRVTGYNFVLMDSECKQVIRSVSFPEYVTDNSYRTISFEPIEDSANKTYCFTVKRANETTQQFALQMSEPSIYQKGLLKIAENEQDRDLVFQVVYAH